jgi:hypothetical protein
MVTAAIIALLGAVFILVPARYGLPAGAGGGPARRATLAYFGCPGLGYVLVE